MQFTTNSKLETITNGALKEAKSFYTVTCGKSGTLKMEYTVNATGETYELLKMKAETKFAEMKAELLENLENLSNNPEKMLEKLLPLVKWARQATIDGQSQKPKANYWLGEEEEEAAPAKKVRKAEETEPVKKSPKKQMIEDDEDEESAAPAKKKVRKVEIEDDEDEESTPKNRKLSSLAEELKNFADKTRDLEDEEEDEPKTAKKKVRKVEVEEEEDEQPARKQKGKNAGSKIRNFEDYMDDEEPEVVEAEIVEDEDTDENEYVFILEKESKNHKIFVPEDEDGEVKFSKIYLPRDFKGKKILVTIS